MSEQIFLLPDLGEGLTEADLLNWLVNVGDEIKVDQPIAEVETAKSAVEVPSPYAGTVATLHGAAGETLAVGKPLITVTAASASSSQHQGAASPDAQTLRTEERAGSEESSSSGSGNVLIGYGTPDGHGGTKRTRRPKTHAATVKTLSGQPKDGPQKAGPGHNNGAAVTATRVVSPLVRKMARDAGLDITGMTGSGPDGLILRSDVEAALAHGPALAEESAAPLSGLKQQNPMVDPRTGLAVASHTPLKGVRKTVALAMSQSRKEIPEATVWVDVDATALLDMRAALKKQDPQNTPGLLAFIARFVTAGLSKFPELNTRLENGEIINFDGVNLGFAAQTERGLMVPSVRGADKLSARELDSEIRRLTAVVRDGKATPAELTSGTFTLNNYGVFGVDGSAAIINYPEVAILGIGRIIDKPWVVDGQLSVRKVTELTLAFDHRVCDGGTAGGFLRYIADAIENPGSLLSDL